MVAGAGMQSSPPFCCRQAQPKRRSRVCSKINSEFAGGCLAVWLGASDEHTRQRSVRSEQRRQTAKQPQPSGAGRRLAICFVARRSQPTGGDAPSSRLASGQAALPPKSEVIFEQTLSAVVGTARCAVRAPFEGRNVCVTGTCAAIGSARSDAGGDIAARCPYPLTRYDRSRSG